MKKNKLAGISATLSFVVFLVTSIIFIGPSDVFARQELLPAPRLYAKYPTTIVWKWHHEDPYRWNVYISIDGGNTFFLIEDYWHWGDSRRFSPDGGSSFVYIVGVDQYGDEITKRSNAVRPDDAKMPK